MSLSAGTVVAGYRIERVLGAGGMGTVYLARHRTLPRWDALKVLSAELSRDPQFRTRFLREAEMAATLNHPNIVTVYDRGETADGQLWIAMQFVDGTDAGNELAQAKMTAPRAAHIIAQVAQALDYAHSRKLLHRDVKPANFLLSGPVGHQERVLLADFGIARALDDTTNLTATGALVATASYAAPEAIEGQQVDHRADVCSLGCSLFRLLTGRTPYAQFSGIPAVMMAHLFQPIPRATEFAPWLPPAIDDVVVHALAKHPAQRYQSAGALATAAAAALRGQPAVSPPASAVDPRSWPTPPPARLGQWPPPGTAPAADPARYAVTQPPSGWRPPPPKRRVRRWWALGGAAAAMVATVVLVVAATLAGTNSEHHRPTSASPTTTATPTPAAAVASANDTGPVSLIIDDPTCPAWGEISEAWVEGPLTKWAPDSPDSPINVPASAWTPEQRTAMQDVGHVLRDIADKTVPLAKATPHRIVRELYEQFIAYARAYSDSLSNYFPQLDVHLGAASEDVLNALISTCNAVKDGAAVARSVLVTAPASPLRTAPPQDPANPQRAITAADKVTCGEWTAVNQQYDGNATIKDWDKVDKNIPADQLSPEQKASNDAVAPVILSFADDIDRTAQRSNNPIIQDFATFSAQYERAMAKGLPTYEPHDQQLGKVGGSARRAVIDACGAVGA